MKTQAMMLAALMLAGCGTVQTVVFSDESAVKSLKDRKSYCGAVPRIYSGMTFDFCYLNAPLQSGFDDQTHSSVPFVVVADAIISGALDTLLLPYTIYRQQADGSIIVTE